MIVGNNNCHNLKNWLNNMVMLLLYQRHMSRLS